MVTSDVSLGDAFYRTALDGRDSAVLPPPLFVPTKLTFGLQTYLDQGVADVRQRWFVADIG